MFLFSLVASAGKYPQPLGFWDQAVGSAWGLNTVGLLG